jgi:hypothetical protein
MTRLILMVSLILLWTKEVKANPLHYTLRYRESTERRQSKVAAAGGGKHKGVSSTPKRRSLQGVSCGTLFRCVTQTIHDPKDTHSLTHSPTHSPYFITFNYSISKF